VTRLETELAELRAGNVTRLRATPPAMIA